MTLNEMLIERSEYERKIKNLEDELVKLRAAAPDLKKKMNDAAENGDVDAYSIARQANDKNEDSIFVKDTVLKKLRDTPKVFARDEVIAAWDDHITAYNKKFGKKSYALNKTIETLYKQYEDMLADQCEMLRLRRKCIDLFGGSVYSGTYDKIYTSVLKAEMIPRLRKLGFVLYEGVQYADMLSPLFLDFGIIDKDTAVKNGRIIEGISTDIT